MNPVVVLFRSLTLFAVLLFSISASAQVEKPEVQFEKFKAFLDVHNQGNPTKIEFDRWYALDDLIRAGNDVTRLMSEASRYDVNLVVELPPVAMGIPRYLTTARTNGYTPGEKPALNVDWAYGVIFVSSPTWHQTDFISQMEVGGEWIELKSRRYSKEVFFFIPGEKSKLQTSNLHRLGPWHGTELVQELTKSKSPQQIRNEVQARYSKPEGEFGKFKTILGFYNQSNPTKIELNRWYKIQELVENGNDISTLMLMAEKTRVNLVVEMAPFDQMPAQRFLTQASTDIFFGGKSLHVDYVKGIRYEESPSKYESVKTYSSGSVSLAGRANRDAYVLIPDNELQTIDLNRVSWKNEETAHLEKALAKYPFPSIDVRTEVQLRMVDIEANAKKQKIRERSAAIKERLKTRKR